MAASKCWVQTPSFEPSPSQGQWSLVGCRLWGHRVGHDWSDLAAAAAAAASQGGAERCWLRSHTCKLGLWYHLQVRLYLQSAGHAGRKADFHHIPLILVTYNQTTCPGMHFELILKKNYLCLV